MGGCMTKEKEAYESKDPVIITKKPKYPPSLQSIEDNQLYSKRLDKADSHLTPKSPDFASCQISFSSNRTRQMIT